VIARPLIPIARSMPMVRRLFTRSTYVTMNTAIAATISETALRTDLMVSKEPVIS